MGKELLELSEELCAPAKLVKKEVRKIIDKDSLTPAELDNLHKAASYLEKMMACCEDDEWSESSYGNYNMRMRGHYGYEHTPDDMRGYSERRGRSPVTGRYISRGMDGMSGHSIEDRMVAALEDQMDAAKNEYERKMIQDEINRIRMGAVTGR